MARKKTETPIKEEINCPKCRKFVNGKWENEGFIIEHRDDPVYDYVAVPCSFCNPDPARLSYD